MRSADAPRACRPDGLVALHLPYISPISPYISPISPCRPDGLVAPEALLLVGMTLLDLPRAVAHVMVRRVQAKMTPPAAAEGGVSWAVFEACHGGLTLTLTLTRTLSLSLTRTRT